MRGIALLELLVCMYLTKCAEYENVKKCVKLDLECWKWLFCNLSVK